jgi:hypothetical protein
MTGYYTLTARARKPAAEFVKRAKTEVLRLVEMTAGVGRVGRNFRFRRIVIAS